MTKRQTRQYQMLVRIRDFGKAYGTRFAEGGEAQKALSAIAAAVDEIDRFTGEQQTLRRLLRQTKREARRAVAARIGAIAGSARVMAKTVPDADAKFPLPTRRSDTAVLQAGLLFLKEAAAVKDAFVRCGLQETFVEDLQQAVTTLTASIAGRSDGKAGAKVSQVAIRAALKQGMDAVDSLDVLVSNAFGGDIKAMAEWRAKRRIELVGRTAGAGAPSQTPASMPGPVAEPPIPGGDTSPSSSADAADEPLRRAS